MHSNNNIYRNRNGIETRSGLGFSVVEILMADQSFQMKEPEHGMLTMFFLTGREMYIKEEPRVKGSSKQTGQKL